jgi:ATP-dependent DNA helicase RecQ
MAAYALTRRCRHGYLNQYLGGGAISRCQACDNCHPLPRATGALPDERAQALEVLSASAGHGWGRQNLVSLLRGDARASAAALGSPHFGALAYRSDAGVEALIARLEAAGLLRPRQLPSGGAVLELTRQGADALRQPELLDDVVVPPRPPGVPPSVPGGPEAEALFQTLRQWRLEAARTESMPPYVILHDSVLREIAATRPRTLEALSRIKGIGPAKLAKYGEAVLAVVSGGSAAQYQ